jgi:hypothetical protein
MPEAVQGRLVDEERAMKGWPAVLAGALVLAAAALLLAPASSEAKKKGARLFGVIPQTSQLDSTDVARMRALDPVGVRVLMTAAAVQGGPGKCSPKATPRDTCNWDPMDNVIGSAAAAGSRALPFVYGSLPAQTGDLTKPPKTRKQRKAWQGFLRAAVNRYGPGGTYWRKGYRTQFPGRKAKPVKVWQIWNEPGSPAYYKPKPSVRGYAKLLRISNQAVRQACKRCKVMIAGLFASTDRGAIRGRIPAIQFLRRLYKVNGIKKKFDFVGLHPYSRTVGGVMSQARGIRRVMRQNGDGRTPLSISELGWASNRPNGSLLAKGPKGQARMLKSAFRRLQKARGSLRLSDVYWFSLRDVDPSGPTSCPNCPYTGLLNQDGSTKRSFKAFRSFTH